MAHVDTMKKRFQDARHHCFAYIIGRTGETFRINDDGEPSSTAGKPMIGQLRSFGLCNVVAIVVRYFGGTKLGTSGLINAYREATRDALAKATIREQNFQSLYQLDFDYKVTSDVQQLLHHTGATIQEASYEACCHYIVAVPEKSASPFHEQCQGIETLTIKFLSNE